jgi:hypothetical protein
MSFGHEIRDTDTKNGRQYAAGYRCGEYEYSLGSL